MIAISPALEPSYSIRFRAAKITVDRRVGSSWITRRAMGTNQADGGRTGIRTQVYFATGRGPNRAPLRYKFTPVLRPYGTSFPMITVPLAANIPPTPWQTEIFAPGTWAGAIPRIWRTLSWSAYIPYMPECI